MLVKMQAKITEEGEEHKKMFNKMMCECKTGADGLQKAIADAEKKIPLLDSKLEAEKQEKNELVAGIQAAKKARTGAETAITDGKKLHEEAAKNIADEIARLKEYIAAINKAIPALEKGMANGTTGAADDAAFLQSSAASVLQRLSVSIDMSTHNRDVLSAFLSGGSSNGYQPQSGSVVGILEQMKENMMEDLEKAENGETADGQSFAKLMEAKEEEIKAQTKSIEEKTTQSGDLAVDIASDSADLEDTSAALKGDQKYLAEMTTSCDTAKKDYEAYHLAQVEELKAIADTIRILNEDDALEIFKKTLQSPTSFLQMRSTSRALRHRVLKALRSRRHPAGKAGDPRLAFLELAIRGDKVSFKQILQMIDDLIGALRKEQGVDDTKQEYCKKELEKGADTEVKVSDKIAFLKKVKDEHEDSIAALDAQIKEKVKSIEELDKQVKQATATRKEEHDLYVEELQLNNAAKALLMKAKKRLASYYQPSDELGSATSFLQLREAPSEVEDLREVPYDEDKPGSPGFKFEKRSGEGSNVLQFIDNLIGEIGREIEAMMAEEKDAQKDYEKMVFDAREKRESEFQSMGTKEGTRATKQEDLMVTNEKLKLKEQLKKENDELLAGLHKECDWLLEYHGARVQARNAEIEALVKAKAVFSGSGLDADREVSSVASVALRDAAKLRGA